MRIFFLISLFIHCLLFATSFEKKAKSGISRTFSKIKYLKSFSEIGPKEPVHPIPPRRERDSPANTKDEVHSKASSSHFEQEIASMDSQYATELRQYIEQNQFYPSRALRLKQSGSVKVRLEVNRRGAFQKIKFLERAPYDSLNIAAENLFTRLRSFKPLPKALGKKRHFIISLNYDFQDRGF